MLNINKADVEQLVGIIEYLLEKEGTVSVDKLLADNGITFDEYRLVSALAMPAIRQKNLAQGYRVKGAAYKGLYTKEKHEREKLDEVLRIAKEYLDRRFKDGSNVYSVADAEGLDADEAVSVGDDGENGDAEGITIVKVVE